ncbi:hypothetical protein [Cupriavidus metallidurans]|nr:hypothetical protein [Cupriavidus metallidurans]MDE4918326.1 hypothetical protein [Cupriavidus metallidurans]
MAANAIAHAATMAGAAWQAAAAQGELPSALYRPALFIDGNQWCALYGDNLQDGVAGFGDSPAEAMHAFNAAWWEKLAARQPQPSEQSQQVQADAVASSVLCVSAKELLDVLELAAPDVMPEIDRDHEQMDTEMCIGRLSGSIDDDGNDSGPGLFAWYTEYPEEGVIPLRLDRDVQASITAMSREQSQQARDGGEGA